MSRIAGGANIEEKWWAFEIALYDIIPCFTLLSTCSFIKVKCKRVVNKTHLCRSLISLVLIGEKRNDDGSA